MSRHQQRIPEYIADILQAAARIDRYVAGMDQAAFLEDERTQDAVMRNFEIVGEASRRIMRADPEFSAGRLTPELQLAYDMRNFLSHGYDRVDSGVVWHAVQHELPAFRAKLEKFVADPPTRSGGA